MSRPRFETAVDRAREHEAAAALSVAWRCSLLASPPLAGFDYRARRGGLTVAVVEIKARLNRAPGDFGGVLFLNADKQAALIAAAADYGARAAVFCWHFPQVIHYIDVLGPDWRAWPVERRGRADRDGRDVCPAYRVPLAATRRVPTVRGSPALGS